MQKKTLLRNGMIIGIVILFVGVIIVQSAGILERTGLFIDQSTGSSSVSSDTNNQNGPTSGTKPDFTNSTFSPFLEKMFHRFPSLKNMAKHLGWNDQDISKAIKKYANENTIKIYITVLSKLFKL